MNEVANEVMVIVRTGPARTAGAIHSYPRHTVRQVIVDRPHILRSVLDANALGFRMRSVQNVGNPVLREDQVCPLLSGNARLRRSVYVISAYINVVYCLQERKVVWVDLDTRAACVVYLVVDYP